MANFRRVEEGDPICDSDYNAIAERLERFANLSVSGGHLRLWEFPDGKHLALHVPVETLALLSGSSSPYSFVEVDESTSGAFATRGVGDSGTANAYEINSVAGLGGKVVSLVWTEAGDWRFQYVRVACNWTFVVHNPGGGAVSGAVVTISQGGGPTLATCTTSGAGSCTFSIPADTYDVVVTPPSGSGYATYTATIAHTCAQTTTVTFSVDSDHLFFSACGPCLVYPKTITLTGSVSLPSDTLTWDTGLLLWVGTADLVTNTSLGPDCVGTYQANCSVGGKMQLSVKYTDPNNCATVTAQGLGQSGGLAGGDSCNPLHAVSGINWTMDE